MDNDRQKCADQILETIEYGQLSEEETERRLNKIIDDELSEPVDADYDATKVELCNSLLWQLRTHGRVKMQLPSDQARDRIKRSLTAHKRKEAGVRRFIYAAVAALAVFLGLTALNVISPIQWFTRESINEEQQYLIEGHEISIDYIAKAIAEHENAGNIALTTSDPNELESFLGFDPRLPDSLNAVYSPTRYDAHIDSQSIRINAQYQEVDNANSDAPLISIRLTLFTSVEEARISYEQNAEGEFIVVENTNVYRYTNTWTSNYLWLEDHTLVKLLTSLPFIEADKYVEEIIEWRNNP